MDIIATPYLQRSCFSDISDRSGQETGLVRGGTGETTR